MTATSRHRRSVPTLSLWLTALAVFYLTIGVHLLHPLFHQSHEDSTHHALAYQDSEQHHHAPCPLRDYCQTIHHFDLADAAPAVPIFSLDAVYIRPIYRQIQQHLDTSYPARAPPSA
ncbi:hypothetical protein [uncultured Desulfuromonas sp.]|uniref:hypothetical protein n=1 Tax=uncultured Desulfuromonas sp. TaxID=181013 RepID=UPI002AAC1D32|nr:hypothetical protein [uncultured Desulfuromonas sp.]